MNETFNRKDCCDTINMRSMICLVVCNTVGDEELDEDEEVVVFDEDEDADEELFISLAGLSRVKCLLNVFRQSQSKKVR